MRSKIFLLEPTLKIWPHHWLTQTFQINRSSYAESWSNRHIGHWKYAKRFTKFCCWIMKLRTVQDESAWDVWFLFIHLKRVYIAENDAHARSIRVLQFGIRIWYGRNRKLELATQQNSSHGMVTVKCEGTNRPWTVNGHSIGQPLGRKKRCVNEDGLVQMLRKSLLTDSK